MAIGLTRAVLAHIGRLAQQQGGVLETLVRQDAVPVRGAAFAAKIPARTQVIHALSGETVVRPAAGVGVDSGRGPCIRGHSRVGACCISLRAVAAHIGITVVH